MIEILNEFRDQHLSDTGAYDFKVWEGSLDDKEHPKQVLGFTWHVFNEKDVTPYLNKPPTKTQ